MNDLSALLQQGANNAWLFIPTAILLGALHGLEPGHSKTMMAAFIVAIHGTMKQAILLGLAATISHTAVVWAVALGGMYLGQNLDAETTEPYFQVASALIIIAVALWMLMRTWREQKEERAHTHSHDHHEDIRRIDTGHGLVVELTVKEDGIPPIFWLAFERKGEMVAPPVNQNYSIETQRPDGTRQTFLLVNRGMHLESQDTIPEPHDFRGKLIMEHGDHAHEYDFQFSEENHHHHGVDISSPDYQDAHERAHASDISRRFANKKVTTGQILIFGLTGGLIPCPAAITVLLLCLQLKKITLGAALVVCFSIGLALTLVASGVVAAMSVKYASKRWSGFGKFARHAPYFSSGLIMLIGLYIGYHGIIQILHPTPL